MRTRFKYTSKWMKIYLISYFVILAINCVIQHFLGYSFFADLCNYMVIPATSGLILGVLPLMIKELENIDGCFHYKK